MAYDGLVMAAIAAEISEWSSARIERIHQPEANTLMLLLHHRQKGKTRLAISANPIRPRLYLTDSRWNNPPSPPMFCMLLRKHLTNARIQSVQQHGLERILTLHLSGKDELGNCITYKLITEIMGRHSNIILVGPDDNVVDSIRRIPPSVSSVRIILPGVAYRLPEHQKRFDTLNLESASQLAQVLCQSKKRLATALVRQLTGISPLLARELLYRAHLSNQLIPQELTSSDWLRLWQEITHLQTVVREAAFKPSLAKKDYAAIQLRHLDGQPWNGSMNSLVACVAQKEIAAEIIAAARDKLLSKVHQLLQKEERKLQHQIQEQNVLQQDLQQRWQGELILANIHIIPKQASKAKVIDYYDEDLAEIEIQLDPGKNAAQNAQTCFQRYERAQQGLPLIEKHIQRTKTNITYLLSLQDSLERAEDIGLIKEIEAEMRQNGIIPPSTSKSVRSQTDKPSAPLQLQAPDGCIILVGRNNMQNEQLYRTAASQDWWLHVKDMPGSHVLIKGAQNEPAPETLEMAATLAAYFSQGRQSDKVPVDYTRRKYVRKPKGSPPGFVTYTEQKTIIVNPQDAKLQ